MSPLRPSRSSPLSYKDNYVIGELEELISSSLWDPIKESLREVSRRIL